MLSYRILERKSTKLYFIESCYKDFTDIPAIYWNKILIDNKIAYFKTESEAEQYIAKLESEEIDETATVIKKID